MIPLQNLPIWPVSVLDSGIPFRQTSSVRIIARSEYFCSYPHHGAALLHRDFVIRRHSHRNLGKILQERIIARLYIIEQFLDFGKFFLKLRTAFFRIDVIHKRSHAHKPHDVYDEESGTSLAAPIVSGSIALLYASEPDATADDIREALYESADAIVDPDNDRSAVSGSHGALNTDAALDYLDGLVEPEPEPAGLPFTDVFQGAWYYNSVAFVYKNGIMGGYTGTTLFGTEDPIYREQLAQLLYNYMGNGEIAPAAPQFDVNQNEYYHEAVNWAVSNGIMNGYTEADGSSIRFGVGDVLTREQLASVFANLARKAGDTADATKFNSMPDHIYTTAWARDNLIWAVDKGVINGVETDSGIRYLNPLGICKRCEAAAIVHNCIEKGLL